MRVLRVTRIIAVAGPAALFVGEEQVDQSGLEFARDFAEGQHALEPVGHSILKWSP